MDFFDNVKKIADAANQNTESAASAASSAPGKPAPESPEALKTRIAEAERLLAAEKEKVMLANLKQSQAKAVEAQVEYSIKDIQQKVQRDRRERELEDERTELRGKLKSLEDKLVSERETWVHILKTNLQAQPAAPVLQTAETPAPAKPAAPDFENLIIDRLNAMEKRWSQEQQLLRRELHERVVRPTPPESPRLAKLQEEYHRALTEKTVLAQELASVKDTVAKLSNQGSYLDQISTVVLTLRDAVSTLSLQSGATLDFARNAAQKEEEYTRAKDQLKKLSAVQAQHEQTLQQRDENIKILNADKLRAVQELLKLKQGLTQIRAVNSALERELNRVEAEKQAMQASAKQQASLIERLKQDMADNETKYLNDVNELTRKWEEQKIEMSDLTAQLSKIQAGHEQKVEELNSLLKEQAASYQARIERLEALQKTSEEKLCQVEEERRQLQERCDLLISENETFKKERGAFETDKTRLETDLARLTSEKEALSAHITKLTTHGRQLYMQKQQLDVAVHMLQSKARENMAAIASLNREMSDLNKRNLTLAAEMTAKEAAAAARQAQLQTEAERQQAQLKAEAEARQTQLKTEAEARAAQIQAEAEARQAQLKAQLAEETARQAAELARTKEEMTRRQEQLAKAHQEAETSLKEMLSHETAVSAGLTKKLDRLEIAALDFTSRLKWMITGKPPAEEETRNNEQK